MPACPPLSSCVSLLAEMITQTGHHLQGSLRQELFASRSGPISGERAAGGGAACWGHKRGCAEKTEPNQREVLGSSFLVSKTHIWSHRCHLVLFFPVCLEPRTTSSLTSTSRLKTDRIFRHPHLSVSLSLQRIHARYEHYSIQLCICNDQILPNSCACRGHSLKH